MTDADPGAVLRRSKTIAVVGLSSNPARPSYGVARYLRSQGYRIIPVNPNETEVLGERAYPSVSAIPERVDLVDVFRVSDAARATPCGPAPGRCGCNWASVATRRAASPRMADSITSKINAPKSSTP